jgi:hypothetical protein
MQRNARIAGFLGIALLLGLGVLALRDSIPASAVAWALIGSGLLWTVWLLYFDRLIRRDPGRFGLIGAEALAAGPRAAALVCGLLTLLLTLFALRTKVGWPEIITMVAACVLLVRWLVASFRLSRRSAQRSEGQRRKPEHWRPLNKDRKQKR